MFFGSIESCELAKLSMDWKSWCLEDPMRCMYGKGLEGRVIFKAVEIVSDLKDLIELLMADDSCYNTAEQVDEIGEAMFDMGELVSYWSGFETRWDATAAPQYITMQDFEAQLGEFDFETGPILESYWQMDWPQLTETVKQFD
jgi:hypothetical protein